MKYNESMYNIIITQNNDYVFLYNAYSGAFAKLEKTVYESINDKVVDDSKPCKYFQELLSEGFIKPLHLNEFNRILAYEKMAIYERNDDRLTFVIAPTLACNLHCHYCFEKGYQRDQFMTNEMVKDVLEYINKQIRSNTKYVHINWFGGEPLIAFDIIATLSENLIKDLQEKGIQYSASMITNGVLLTPERVNILSEKYALKKVQITVDGTEEIYCRQKGATPKQFRQVLNNIKEAIKYIHVLIRFNCGKDNYDDILEVTKQIIDYCGVNKNLNLYLAKLVDYSSKCETGYFKQDEFDLKVIEYNQYVSRLLNKEYKPKLPRYRRSFCGQFKLRNLVIGPKGEFYKCEHDLGREDRIIGNVYQGIFYTDTMMNFLENAVHEQCKECKLFPLCIGGCPSQKRDLKEGQRCWLSIEYIKQLLMRY